MCACGHHGHDGHERCREYGAYSLSMVLISGHSSTAWANARPPSRHAANSALQARGKSEPKCLPSREVEEPPAPLICQEVLAFTNEFDVTRSCTEALGAEYLFADPVTVGEALELCATQLENFLAIGIVPNCRRDAPAGQVELLTAVLSERDTVIQCSLNTYPSCPTTIPDRDFPSAGITVASSFCGCPAVTLETLS